MLMDKPINLVPASKLSVQGVSKWYKTPTTTVHALDDVSLEVAEGEFVCLGGPSGCGKTTLLDIIAGLTKPDQGQVLADSKPVTGPGWQRLVMFQEAALFPWLTVFGNVMFGLKLNTDLTDAERRSLAREHLALVGLEKFSGVNVHELSGGMKQRAALARALAPDPDMLLMDEPLASLDALTREQLYTDIQRIWSSRRKTILLVTHNVREAVCLGDRVILLSAHPGRVRKEYRIPLARPRDINDAALSRHAAEITAALKGYMGSEVAE